MDSTHIYWLNRGKRVRNIKGQENYMTSAETIDDNDKHYLGHLSGICGFRSEQTPVTPKHYRQLKFFFNRYYPIAFFIIIIFFIYTACVYACYVFLGLNNVVSLENKKREK